MARKSYDIEPRFDLGYSRNPDWTRDFNEDQDRRTKTINRILDITVKENLRQNNTMLSDVYFTKYWNIGNYFLVYKLKEEYHRVEVLVGAIVESTDEVLSWYDLTTQFNFDIIIVTPYRTIVRSYFDLLYEYLTMSGHSFTKRHPRIEELKEWLFKTRHRRYERITPKISLFDNSYLTSKKIEQIELLELRGDITPKEQDRYLNRQRGIRPGQYNGVMGGESFQQGGVRIGELPGTVDYQFEQQLIERQRELYQNQMSLQWSVIQEQRNLYAEIELPNVTVTQRVSKLNKILKKLKL